MTLGSAKAGEVQRHRWCAHVLSCVVVRSTRSPVLVRTGRRERATRTPDFPTFCLFIYPVNDLYVLNRSYRLSAFMGLSIQIKTTRTRVENTAAHNLRPELRVYERVKERE